MWPVDITELILDQWFSVKELSAAKFSTGMAHSHLRSSRMFQKQVAPAYYFEWLLSRVNHFIVTFEVFSI